MGEGFSRIEVRDSRGCWGAGLGAISAGGATGDACGASGLGALVSGAGMLGAGAAGGSDAGRTSAMLCACGNDIGRTVRYTIPEASTAPAAKATAICQFMLNPFTS